LVLRRCSVSLLVAVIYASAPLSAFAQAPLAPAVAPAVQAQNELAAGDKSARTKDFDGALTHYQASQQAAPSARAEMGVADALYSLGRLGESYDAYNDVQQTYGPKLGAVEKGLVSKRLKELATKTGWLSIRVSEAGAQVGVDGKPFGTSPVPALVRVLVGTHDVRIDKPGFVSFQGKAEVAADGKAVIEANLAPVATLGHVIVHAAGDTLRVLVDGVDVGATPWEGDLPPGAHQIAGRSASSTADAQSIDVAAGARMSVDLVSSAISAHLKVSTSDGKGIIYVDGVVKGEGAFTGDVAPGTHTIDVSRDGFQRYEKTVALAERQTWAETVTLQITAGAGSGAGEADRAYEGIYGGFGLAGLFGVGGMGTELETNCGQLGAASCSTPGPIGGGAFGYLGYTWNPVGFELVLGGIVDEAKQTATFASGAPTASSGLVPAATPARTESFSFLRFGGFAAVRARVAFQTRLFRGTLAGGLGASYRSMAMERDAVATDGSGRSDKYVPGGVGYVSPGITAEGAVQFRLTPTVAVQVGLFMWADNASIAGSNAVQPSSTPHALTNGSLGSAAPIPTPQYHLATGPQVILGPFLGMHFGP
jgi:hypothetical protein